MATLDRAFPGLTGIEKALLLLPVLAGAFLGLLALFAPAFLAGATGYPGNDHYIYRLAGSAALGYTVAHAIGITADRPASVRLLLVATLTFGLASIFACLMEIALHAETDTGLVGSHPQLIVYAILVSAVGFVGIAATLLYAWSDVTRGGRDVATWVVWYLGVATALATVFGLLPLLVPEQFGTAFGLRATDTFIYRMAGAGCLGYGIMGIFELRSRNWGEIRLPVVMAATFNGLSFLASLVAIYNGEGLLLAYLVALASLCVTVASVAALVRRGR